MKKTIIIAVILLIAIQIFAGVISAKDLAKLSKKEDIIIISARSASDYSSKHITGAINLYHKDLYAEDGVEAMLKPASEIAAILGEKGISADSKVVIYDDGSGKAAGRIYWILKYIGMQDVNILDGHIKAWMKARKPVTKNPTEITPVTFTANVNENIYASMDYVKSNLGNASVMMVDVRSKEEYEGKNEDEKLTRKGHIPGAVNFDYAGLINDKDQIKSKEEIAALLSAAGITKGKEIILYCATSVRAGIVYMALTSIMEFPNVRVYDGAFYEWQSVDANEVSN